MAARAAVEAGVRPQDLQEATYYSRGVAITGMGIVSGLGLNPDTAYQNAIAGTNVIKPLVLPYDQVPVHIAGSIDDYDGTDRLNKRTLEDGQQISLVKTSELSYLSRSAQFSLDAAFQAMNQAGVINRYNEKEGLRTKTGWRVIYTVDAEELYVAGGTGVGGTPAQSVDTQHKLDEGETAEWSDVFNGLTGRNTTPIPLATEAHGGVVTLVAECSTFNNAVALAMDKIRLGKAKMAIVSTAEAALLPLAFAQFDKITALSRETDPNKAPTALDKNNSGFAMAEGGAALFLEDYDHAVARGAEILAVATGYGERGDAYDKSSPHPEGKYHARTIEIALEEAGPIPGDARVLYNGHFTGTGNQKEGGDISELRAFKRAFGDKAGTIFLNSTKPMHGHLLSTSAGVEAVINVQTLRHGVIAPTIKSEEPFEETEGLLFVRNEAQKADVGRVVSSAAGFGGGVVTIVVDSPSLIKSR